MPTRLRFHFATGALLALALAAGCSDNQGSSSGLLEVSRHDATLADSGLALTADPAQVVIDPDDPTTPTDPAHGDEKYRTTALVATATDSAGLPQAGLNLTFTATGGALTSAGAPIATDSTGLARDTLRIYVSDPDSIQVTVADSTRSTTIVVTNDLQWESAGSKRETRSRILIRNSCSRSGASELEKPGCRTSCRVL